MADDALELENIFNNGIGHHVTMFPTKNNNTSTNTHVLPKGRRLIQNSRIKTIKKKKAISSKHPKSGVSLSSSHNKKDKEQPETKEYICHNPSCGKVFLDRNSYRKHIITHGEKQYICQAEGCGKRFLDNSKLKRHMLVHTGEKPYKCELCNKRFSLDFNLRTHLRIHTGEKPYVCSFKGCNKRFSQSSNLSAHEKTHLLPSNTPFTAVNASNGLNAQSNSINNTNDINQSASNNVVMMQKNECTQMNGSIGASKGMDVPKKKKFFKVIRPHYECGSGFAGVQKPKQLVILDRQKYEEEQEEKLREKMRLEEERKRLEKEMLERQEKERLEREEKEREEREQKEREEREAREKERLENLERLKLLYNKENNIDDENVDVNINGSDTDINSQFEFLIPYYLTKDYIKETHSEYFQ